MARLLSDTGGHTRPAASTTTKSVAPRRISYADAARILAIRDPVIARLVGEAGLPRLRKPAETPFAALVRAIVYQQLAGRAAAAIPRRLVTALDKRVEPQ